MSLLKTKASILDIGCCSTAQQAKLFFDNGFNVTSIDLSQKCIDTVQKKYPEITFFQMDMTKMNFKDNSFDAVNASYSIIHIQDEDLNNLFSDFNRILIKTGKLSISVHAGDFYDFFEEDKGTVFYRTYKKEQLEHLLQSHGFKIINIEQRKPIYDFEFQSERIYIIAEKE